VTCDKQKLDGRRLLGAPDLIIEILSPSNAKNDKVYKMNKYEQAGVKEYWIVDPLYDIVEVYLLKDGAFYREGIYAADESVPVHLFKHLTIDLTRIFQE
jgi:Uma2 family endonuclease